MLLKLKSLELQKHLEEGTTEGRAQRFAPTFDWIAVNEKREKAVRVFLRVCAVAEPGST